MYDAYAPTIPAGHVACPACDSIGYDINHTGDDWDDDGTYRPVCTYTACHLCNAECHVTEAAAAAYTEED